jgi:hypothetical protein
MAGSEVAMVRLLLAIVGGLLVAFLLVFASDALFHSLVPSASALPRNLNDSEAMAVYVANQPTGVLAGLELGWGIAALVGSAIAARFGSRGEWPGWVVGVLFLLATASNFLMIPHPAWMITLAVIAIIVATLVGGRLGARLSRARQRSTP